MYGSHLCPAKNETVTSKTELKLFCHPVPTLIYLWEIYIFPGSVCLFCCREICGPILGIYNFLPYKWMWKLVLRPRNSQKRNTKWDFPCSVLYCNLAANLKTSNSFCGKYKRNLSIFVSSILVVSIVYLRNYYYLPYCFVVQACWSSLLRKVELVNAWMKFGGFFENKILFPDFLKGFFRGFRRPIQGLINSHST